MSAPDDIMRATWRALCTHGYADLTTQDIADETDRSKAALHYHYDSKADLLESFLDHVTDRFLTRLHEAEAGADDPETRLAAILDAALFGPETDDREDVQTALLELKAQAPHEPPFRERLAEADSAFRALLADVLADGVDAGQFRADLDPATTAQALVTVLSGGQLRQVALGEDADDARALVESYLERAVYADGDR